MYYLHTNAYLLPNAADGFALNHRLAMFPYIYRITLPEHNKRNVQLCVHNALHTLSSTSTHKCCTVQSTNTTTTTIAQAYQKICCWLHSIKHILIELNLSNGKQKTEEKNSKGK